MCYDSIDWCFTYDTHHKTSQKSLWWQKPSEDKAEQHIHTDSHDTEITTTVQLAIKHFVDIHVSSSSMWQQNHNSNMYKHLSLQFVWDPQLVLEYENRIWNQSIISTHYSHTWWQNVMCTKWAIMERQWTFMIIPTVIFTDLNGSWVTDLVAAMTLCKNLIKKRTESE